MHDALKSNFLILIKIVRSHFPIFKGVRWQQKWHVVCGPCLLSQTIISYVTWFSMI
jgi:hypothetical protein